jgi:hypothetical protein
MTAEQKELEKILLDDIKSNRRENSHEMAEQLIALWKVASPNAQEEQKEILPRMSYVEMGEEIFKTQDIYHGRTKESTLIALEILDFLRSKKILSVYEAKLMLEDAILISDQIRRL